ncbi:glycosyltransferase family 2 protein [Azotobacter chroococcum]|uniref:glycosyltransferase family 2 protein n=1 Tax=Azotobacter chroococcum TaxID=353 RepID=UPI0010392E9C|nr:glycosyltransferase family 2 protein [Azotobacter chroococcum]TBW09970.1 glycosyltransferase family 2 protein [Azotobacter chroococcum]
MAEAIFWLCLLLPVYAYLGYPLLVALLAQASRPRPSPASAEPPTVSVIVAAHNEAEHIGAKLRTLLGQDYPGERLQILVASDGSTDATVAEALASGDPRIEVLELPRQGKAAALNAAAARARGEILVFTDADNRWMPDCLGELMRAFADPQVGAAGGHIEILDGGPHLGLGDQLYRRYETWLRRAESRAGCLVAVDGALLALRRELFRPVPAEANDDFFLSTCAPAAGRRIQFAERARVLDRGVDEAGKQFRRRLRVTVGGLQSLACRRALMNPLRHGRYAIALLSHKLLRRLAPLLLIPLLASNLWLWDAGAFYRMLLLAQLGGYALALAGLLDRGRRLPKPFRLAAFLLVTLAGMTLGLWQFLRGQRYSLWTPQQNR